MDGRAERGPVPLRPARVAHRGGTVVQHLRATGVQPARAARGDEALGADEPSELGNLWPQRDLIFVTDTAAGLVAAAQGGLGLEVFNVGTGIGTTIGDVMETIGDITGCPVEVRQVPERMRDGDGHLISDPQKLMQATGWKPQYDVEAGLRKLFAAATQQ